jgi:hypothetical protein
MGQGVPPGWERLAATIEAKYGRTLMLSPPPMGFDLDPGLIEVGLDGERIGGLQFFWSDDVSADDVIDELADVLSEFLVQDLGDDFNRT